MIEWTPELVAQARRLADRMRLRLPEVQAALAAKQAAAAGGRSPGRRRPGRPPPRPPRRPPSPRRPRPRPPRRPPPRTRPHPRRPPPPRRRTRRRRPLRAGQHLRPGDAPALPDGRVAPHRAADPDPRTRRSRPDRHLPQGACKATAPPRSSTSSTSWAGPPGPPPPPRPRPRSRRRRTRAPAEDVVLEALAGPEHEQARAALRIEFQAERARTGFPPRPDFPPLPEPADDATTTTTPATGRGRRRPVRAGQPMWPGALAAPPDGRAASRGGGGPGSGEGRGAAGGDGAAGPARRRGGGSAVHGVHAGGAGAVGRREGAAAAEGLVGGRGDPEDRRCGAVGPGACADAGAHRGAAWGAERPDWPERMATRNDASWSWRRRGGAPWIAAAPLGCHGWLVHPCGADERRRTSRPDRAPRTGGPATRAPQTLQDRRNRWRPGGARLRGVATPPAAHRRRGGSCCGGGVPRVRGRTRARRRGPGGPGSGPHPGQPTPESSGTARGVAGAWLRDRSSAGGSSARLSRGAYVSYLYHLPQDITAVTRPDGGPSRRCIFPIYTIYPKYHRRDPSGR